MTELLKCPFCGNKHPDLFANWSEKYHRYYVYVKCPLCGGQGGSAGEENGVNPEDYGWVTRGVEKAVSKWNTRN